MRNSGFKVYEMIVVLAILMVLAGLLMPVLRNARLSAIREACASNLSQIHQAVLLYEQEQGTLWSGALSFQTGLRPYLGDTFLTCPLAPPRKTKPWERGTPEEQVNEYFVHATPLLPPPWGSYVLECRKRLGDRAPIASCENHLRHIPPHSNIFIRRSGQIVFVDYETWARYSEHLARIARQMSKNDLELPCPKVHNVMYNLP